MGLTYTQDSSSLNTIFYQEIFLMRRFVSETTYTTVETTRTTGNGLNFVCKYSGSREE